MSRDDLIDLMEAHGYEYNPDSDLTLEQLRDLACNVVLMKGDDL